VVGAWTWIPELGMGVATEIDADEAFAGLRANRARFGVVMGLLGVGTLGMFLYSSVLVRMRSQVDKAQRLGRYRIEEKIGEGGMGKVYRARHALLRRPTAIKLLKATDSTSEAVARFEREVQVTSSLTHPNTIAVFDFGHTPDGTFYYAMEYLDGITVGQCVEEDGAQDEARVVHVMKQACGSIVEAHAAGLIHRDLKPANVMLCQRGGLLDFVKVLDFGLVRDEKSELALTRADALTGTPLYLSPEALEAPETIDPRSDLYQLGAVAYYLITGRHVFSGESVVDVLGKHLHSAPDLPSSVLGRPVSPDLERIVLSCLEKDRERRPKSAAELLEAFEGCGADRSWTQKDARVWWEQWWTRHPATEVAASESSVPSGYQIDLDERSG
jgi:serine/threonine protein kinase